MRPDSVNTDGPVINKITGFSINASAQHSKVSAAANAGESLNIKVVAGDLISFTPSFQKVGNPTANINWTAYKYDQFFTDYNDGSATFAVPSEDTILKEGLPKQYTLSAVCSENNSLAIPITIDVVSQEDLDMAKGNTAKLTIMTLQDNKIISTATYHESNKITLEIPAERVDGNLVPKEDTTFKFTASLDKEGALFNVNDHAGLKSPGSDGAYELVVNRNSNISNCYLMFNVADAETETTYSITISAVLVDEYAEEETNSILLVLKSNDQAITSGIFEEYSNSNTLTYSDAFVGDVLSIILKGKENATYSITATDDDEYPTNGFTKIAGSIDSTSIAEVNLLTIPESEDLKDSFTGDIQNGTVTVPFNYTLTVTIPDTTTSDGSSGNSNSSTTPRTITGEININVTYQNTNTNSGASSISVESDIPTTYNMLNANETPDPNIFEVLSAGFGVN